MADGVHRCAWTQSRLTEGPNREESETPLRLAMAGHQMSMYLEPLLESKGSAPRVERSREAIAAQ